MSMSRRQLERTFRQQLDLTTERVARGTPLSALHDDLDQLDRYARLLALRPSKWTADSVAAVIVALVCLAVASALWGTTLSRTNISLNVEPIPARGRMSDWRFRPGSRRARASGALPP